MKRPAANQRTLLPEAAVFCKVCGRRLKTFAARARGIGPTCAKKLVH